MILRHAIRGTLCANLPMECLAGQELFVIMGYPVRMYNHDEKLKILKRVFYAN